MIFRRSHRLDTTHELGAFARGRFLSFHRGLASTGLWLLLVRIAGGANKIDELHKAHLARFPSLVAHSSAQPSGDCDKAASGEMGYKEKPTTLTRMESTTSVLQTVLILYHGQ